MKWTLASIGAGWVVLGAGWWTMRSLRQRDAPLERAPLGAVVHVESPTVDAVGPVGPLEPVELEPLAVDAPPHARVLLESPLDGADGDATRLDANAPLYHPFSRAAPVRWKELERPRP
jgi:hypothetical protein